MSTVEQEASRLREDLQKQEQTIVSVALFGQPGAGKSSLINALTGTEKARVGVQTDVTTEAQHYEHEGLNFVDLPGYGTTKFPKEGYAERFQIETFDLFLCVSSGKLHQADSEFFKELVQRGKTCLFVVNKRDDLWQEGKTTSELEVAKRDDIHKHVGSPVPVLFTSCRNGFGLAELGEAIKSNLNLAKRERWERTAAAWSEQALAAKRQANEKAVTRYAGLSAANGFNPIPGVNIAADVGILVKLFADIRNSYGFSDAQINSWAANALPLIGPTAERVIQFASKEGVMMLLTRFAGRVAVQNVAKYVPFVGQAIAAGMGFALTRQAGMSYLDDCHELAAKVLDSKLKASV